MAYLDGVVLGIRGLLCSPWYPSSTPSTSQNEVLFDRLTSLVSREYVRCLGQCRKCNTVLRVICCVYVRRPHGVHPLFKHTYVQHLDTCTNAYLHTQMHTCTYRHTYVYAFTMFVYLRTYMYSYMHAFTHTHTHTCTHTLTHTHTHTHTYRNLPVTNGDDQVRKE